MAPPAQLAPLGQGAREAGMDQTDHLECEDLMAPQGLPENQEPLERMVHQVFQEVRVIKETLGRPGRKEALA